jgi:hypothetical protein
MAVLTDQERAALHQIFMADRSRARDQLALTKAQLRAAIDATDGWIDTNAAAYNLALPVAARNNLTVQQKTLLFSYVALKRAGII